MKKLIVVAYQEHTGKQYAETLQQLFGSSLEVTFLSMYHRPLTHLDADIILASTYSVCELLEQYVPDFSNIIIANITLRKESLKELQTVPAGTSALLVNTTLPDAIDTISLIYKCGIKHINFTPAYPPVSGDVSCDLAVTPGEPGLVPPGIKRVIDLSDRVLSPKTITEIALRLNMGDILNQPKFQEYFASLVYTDVSFYKMLHQINFLEQQFTFVMQVFDSGVICLDNRGFITYINTPAATLLGKTQQNITGKPIYQIIPAICENYAPSVIKDKVIHHNSNVLIASVHQITYSSVLQGYIVMLKKFTDLEREQLKIRKQVMSRGHVAKYTFHDIVGNSPAILQTKQLAQKLSRSNSSVLIYGQTGTGKELFAQSIHNASPRKNYPFIAINCAAIPENLLESELFGYEDGAFTGAKKGGKPGFFEQAHGGTLFLDEISEMNIHLQTRLLRVLQEKEITRIGGDSVINIDVRIIAASNKRLKDLVNQNSFRKDLYYRLNVLSIQLPPLSRRKEDIPVLIEAMKQELNASFCLTKDAMELLQNMRFEGNIRELRNLVERLIYSDQSRVDADELRQYLDQDEADCIDINDKEQLERFMTEQKHRMDFLLLVLDILQDTYLSHTRLGRKSILQKLEERGVFFSEQEIRTMLQTLSFYGLVRITRGRGGSCITALGMKVLSQADPIFS